MVFLAQDRSQALLPGRSKLDHVRNVRQSNIGACIHLLTAQKIAGSFGQWVVPSAERQ